MKNRLLPPFLITVFSLALTSAAVSQVVYGTRIADTFTVPPAATAGIGGNSTVTDAPGTWNVFWTTAETSANYYSLSGNALGITSAPGNTNSVTGATTVGTRAFSDAFTFGSLEVGDSVTLSFSLNSTAVISGNTTSAGGFNVGLLQNAASSSNQSPFYLDWRSTTDPSAASVSFMTRTSSGFMGASGTIVGGSTTVARSSLASGVFSLTLNKTSAANVFSASLSLNGNSIHSATGLNLASVSSVSTGVLGVRNYATGGPGTFYQGGLTLDDVSLTVVPEPSSYATVIALFAVAVAIRRRLRARESASV